MFGRTALSLTTYGDAVPGVVPLALLLQPFLILVVCARPKTDRDAVPDVGSPVEVLECRSVFVGHSVLLESRLLFLLLLSLA